MVKLLDKTTNKGIEYIMEVPDKSLSILVIVQDDDKEPNKCIESLIACNDVENISMIVYDNSNNEAFRTWAMSQDYFLYAYPENGIVDYSTAINEILNELDIHSDILLVNAHHIAYPGIISRMYNCLYSTDNYGVVAASFNGANVYGLGIETFAVDYMSLAEKMSGNDDISSWDSLYLDPESSIIIRKSLLERLKKTVEKFDRKQFYNSIENIVKQNNFSIQVLNSAYWWNLQDKTIEKLVSRKTEGIKLTIAIPTYNRGNRALESVKCLIKNRKEFGCEDSIEVVVSDNGSTLHLEELGELEKLSEKEKNISFYRSATNKKYKGNIKKIIEMSNGRYCLIQSDEDTTLFPAVLLYMRYLDIHPDVACMKGRTSFQYGNMQPAFGRKGIDAVNLFYLKGNYVSGVIYKREIINNMFLEKLYNIFDNNDAGFEFYPHLFIEAYALLNGSYASSNVMLIMEGTEEDSGDHMGNNMFKYEYPESRIAQGMGYIKQLEFLRLDDKYKVLMYNKVFQKTKYLLNMSKERYLLNGYNWDTIVKDAMEKFRKAFQNIKLQNRNLYKPIIFDYLTLEEANKMS